jgi:signal recognition particle subunit SRP54
MLQQAADIKAAVDPTETLFVVDAMIGQDAVTTANSFAEKVGFTGVVLTKLDGDARGGAALSVTQVTGQPIMFASTGEKLDDFDVFHPERMASRILDMGDVLTLIEQAERHFDAEEAAKAASSLLSGGDFGLDQFLQQMRAIRKMGPLSQILGMLPGMGQMRGQIDSIDEREIDRIEAIIESMTPAERADVSILNGSRRARIAKGAGVQVSDVNGLVTRFNDARQMMRQMGGAMGGMPAGLPRGMGRPRPPQQQAKKKKSGSKVSGNPAKRGAAPVEAAPATSAAAFGLREGAPDLANLGDITLPPELQRLLDSQGQG